MRKLESNVIGIDQGDVVLFSDFEHDGQMLTGEGSRNTRMAVTYSEQYSFVPSVYVSISMLDVSNSGNSRSDVQAENITDIGFDIVFRTWATQRSPAVASRGSLSAQCASRMTGIFRRNTYLRRLAPAFCDQTRTTQMCHSTCSGSLDQTLVLSGRS